MQKEYKQPSEEPMKKGRTHTRRIQGNTRNEPRMKIGGKLQETMRRKKAIVGIVRKTIGIVLEETHREGLGRHR
jgi:hypothetical protein